MKMGSGDTIGGLPKYKVHPGLFSLQPRSSIKFLMIAILIVKIQETIGVTVGNGNVFTGEVKNHMPVGNGTYTMVQGTKFTGYFEDGKMTGMFVVEYADVYGDVYRGEVDEDGTREGKGVYNYAIGNKYDGEWRNGNKTGKGIYFYASGDKYEGQFINNEKQGQGIYFFASGDKYEGEFRNNEKHGKGIYTLGPESKGAGDKYEGEWRNSSRTEHGIYYFYSSGDKYEGEFNESKKNGWGTYIYKSNKNFAEYDGEWNNDLRTGYGKMVYTDGSIYNGQWNSNRNREGEGLLLWPNGTCFYGQMKNDKTYHGLSMTPDLIFSFPPYKNATFNRKGFKVANFTGGEIECFQEDKSTSCYNKPNSTDTMYFGSPVHYYVGDTITVRRRRIMDGFGEYGIDGSFYIGEMKQGIQTGFGLKSEPFLPTLIGTFVDGKLEGIGASISYSAKHRVVYLGGYKNGKPDGPGIFIYPDGEKVLGYFNQGKLDHTKKPIYLHADGTRDSLVTVNP